MRRGKFITFQYYILLSDCYDLDANISESYTQLLQKSTEMNDAVNIRTLDDIMIECSKYNIPKSLDVEKIRNAVTVETNKMSLINKMNDVVLSGVNLKDYCDKYRSCGIGILSLRYYSDEDDNLKEQNFRKTTLLNNGVVSSYPFEIRKSFGIEKLDIEKQMDKHREYCHAKFNRLNEIILNNK